MNDHKLKRCPFCDGPPRLKSSEHDGQVYAAVTCDTYDCPANTGTTPPQAEEAAIEKWNRRYSHE